MMGQADVPREAGAAQPVVAGEAQQAAAAPGDGAKDDWGRSQDTGPTR